MASAPTPFRLRFGQRGLALRLHELEATVMDLVWSQALVLFPVSTVLAVLEKDRQIAYTTVMTTVSRLHEKGLLARVRDGKRYLYSPRVSREQFLELTAREVLNRTLAKPQAIAMLAERVADASADELDALDALIRRRRKELGRD